ncbi:phage holin family protein [Actinoallomurus spadix]|uniref:Phage holin family protein n=1 Tax=Actinoallomurus spadix TaxID=79912 RepID=A0ABP3GRF2_9ACTN|nr:phage holin family protein [Actinoallomurus spadix]MCO5989703.1 phage holin family protein [Actinoallomurus spadix]
MASGVRPSTQNPSDTSTGHDGSTGELVGKAARQISELVHQELALAKAELAEKGKEAGRGAGLFGGAGTVAFYGGGTLVAAVVAGLAVALPVWAAALIVGVALLAIAGLLAAAGRSRMRRATPPVPQQTAESVKTDVQEIKDHLKERHA